MRTHIRYPLIASIILLLSILLLPGSSAKRRGAQPPVSDKSSAAPEPLRARQFAFANFILPPAPSADLAVTKVDTPDPVNTNSELTYTITVTNNGPDAADNASWSDTLPAGTSFVTLSSPAGWSCTTPAQGDTGTVSCSLASFAVGSADFTVVVAVSPSAPA